MTDKQPEALRLADALDSDLSAEWMQGITLKHISDELRRLHEENEVLRARLAQPELGVTLTAAKHPVSLSKPSEYKLSKESLEDVVLEREWQGLTDEEMMMIYGQSHEGKKYSLGRAIEAKLKEKNHAI